MISVGFNSYDMESLIEFLFLFVFYLLVTQHHSYVFAKLKIGSSYMVQDQSLDQELPDIEISRIQESISNLTHKSSFNTGLEEIILLIENSLKCMIYLNDWRDSKVNRLSRESTNILEKTLNLLRKSNNIYSTNYNNVIKNLEEDDKNYIEDFFYGATDIPNCAITEKKLKSKDSVYGFYQVESQLQFLGKK